MPTLPIAQLIGLAIQVARDTRPIPGSSFEMTVSIRRTLDAKGCGPKSVPLPQCWTRDLVS
jgi:hypothetical protein